MPIQQIFFNRYDLLIKLIYALVVTFSCFLVYIKTKELYELTSHKGIKYFRNTFLFFGIAYLLRIFLYSIISISNTLMLSRFFMHLMTNISFFIMIYASSMAFIYLLFSIFWKKIDKKPFNNNYILNLVALVIALVSLDEHHPFIFLILQTILLILLIILGYYNNQSSKKEPMSKLYKIYLLIFILWIITSILEFIIHFSKIIGWLVYLFSILLFLIILFKVSKKLGKNN